MSDFRRRLMMGSGGGKIYSFGGLQIASGPLYYNGSGYEIKNDWTIHSYNSVYDKNEGSTFFSFTQMGELFEKWNFKEEDGDIDNLLNPLNGWRLPTTAEWYTFTTEASPGTTRTGSTYNGNSGMKYRVIETRNYNLIGSSTNYGLLIFPDGEVITGPSTVTQGSYPYATFSEIQSLVQQGCVFLPDCGYYTSYWTGGGSTGVYVTSTQRNGMNCYMGYIGSSSVSTSSMSKGRYAMVRLVKPI